jgi:nucleotide-binding universal stress UspA family protein
VLVPIDGSARSEAALPWAAQLARMHRLTPVLLRVVDTPLVGSSVKTYQRLVASEYLAAASNVDDLRDDLAKEGIRAETHIRRGDVTAAILSGVDELDAAAIVMATSAKGGLGRLLVGSVAESVLRRAAVPVLLVRAEDDRLVQSARLDRVLVPLNGSALSERALDTAQAFAPAGARLLLLGVVDHEQRAAASVTDIRMIVNRSVTAWRMVEAQEYLERQARTIDASRFSVEWTVRVGTPAEEIVTAASGLAVDLVVMGTRASAGPARWLLGSTADAVVRASKRPTLLVNPRAGDTATAILTVGGDQADEVVAAGCAGDRTGVMGRRRIKRAPSPGTLAASRSPS